MTTSHHLTARARLGALALRPIVLALAALLAGAYASLSAQATARVLAPPAVFDLADNRATGFTLHQAGQTLSARRIEP